jgi:GTP-binding protein EngB required for normal cell division
VTETAPSVHDAVARTRRQTIELIDQLTATARTFELPEAPPNLDECRSRLANRTYNVVVAGEAKRGKSTLVNALIGRDLLPTDVDIATSQVFRIRHAEQEAYRLRFEDDSAQPIRAADLPRYGSQVVQDVQGTPRLDQIIRWIEVDVPLCFLPPGVQLFDTPGTGGLYVAHAEITYRLAPLADAVLYVLDSLTPVGQKDVEFLTTLLEVTTDIFFVQTKIDQVNDEDWRGIQQRNERILRERFGDRLPEVRVWPISSANLRLAAETGNEVLLTYSQQPEMAAALDAFLFRVAGWGRLAETVTVAGHFQRSGADTLTRRHRTLLEESAQRRAELPQLLARRRQEFDAAWGLDGSQRRDLVMSLERSMRAAEDSFRQALQPEGEIARNQRARIQRLQTLDEARGLMRSFGGDVSAAVSACWRQGTQRVLGQARTLLAPLMESVEALARTDVPETVPDVSVLPSRQLEEDWFRRVTRAKKDVATGFSMGGTAGAAIGWIFASTILGPLSLLGAVAGALWGLIHNVQETQQHELEDARKRLRKYLSEALERAWEHFLTPCVQYDRRNRVEDYFHRLRSTLLQGMDEAVTKKSAEVEAEIGRLREEAEMDVAQRTERAEQTQNRLEEWSRLGATLQKIAAQVRSLSGGQFGGPGTQA